MNIKDFKALMVLAAISNTTAIVLVFGFFVLDWSKTVVLAILLSMPYWMVLLAGGYMIWSELRAWRHRSAEARRQGPLFSTPQGRELERLPH
jgi:ABC-type nickel/cobalt efflux system permease component RcnA